MMKLNKENEHLVTDNLKLVYYVLRKMNIFSNQPDYEDFISVGNLGLVKAACTFETQRNNAFSSYAVTCIHNEICNYIKRNRYVLKEVSLQEVISENLEEDCSLLENMIESEESNFVRNIEIKEDLASLINFILGLPKKCRLVALYEIGGLTQEKISKLLNVSQAYISILSIKNRSKLGQRHDNRYKNKETYFMDIVGNEYVLTLFSENANKFNVLFSSLNSAETLPDFKVICDRERVIIRVPAYEYAFVFIANIIKEIDEYSIVFSSNSSVVK